MKNITPFTVLVIIFFASFANNSVFCQERENTGKYGVTAGAQFGILYGQVLELVYPVETKGELLSELRWDMKPVFYSGAVLDFGRSDIYSGPGFFSSVSFKAGFGGDSGVMEDRDWRSHENGELTNFSSHTNKTTEFFLVELTAGASLPFKSHFYIKPLFGFTWTRFSFTARDGYIKYAREKILGSKTFYPIDDNPDTAPITGDVISFLQDWLMVTTGFKIGTKILYPFSFDISFKISPLTFTGSKDNHILREETYLDYTRFGLYIEPSGSFSFSTGRVDFSLDVTYRYNGRTKGETYINNWGGDEYTPMKSKAGASLSLLDISALLRIRVYSSKNASKETAPAERENAISRR